MFPVSDDDNEVTQPKPVQHQERSEKTKKKKKKTMSCTPVKLLTRNQATPKKTASTPSKIIFYFICFFLVIVFLKSIII
jgi:hypothetical protein